MNKEKDLRIIKLKNLKVAFANLEDDNPYGKSIMVVIDDPVVRSKIETWVKQNKIGKAEQAGVAQFSEYEGEERFKFKFTDRTKVVNMTGKDAIEGLNRGAVISLVAKAYEYHHKQFGNGVSQSLKAVVVMKPAVNEEDAMTSEYLDELKDDGYSDEDKSDPEAALDVLDDEEEINLDDIPF
jgi:TusA-related sulfurtransferase